jgi:hypothetical protein
MARGRLISRTLGTGSQKFASLAASLGPLGEFAQILYPLIVTCTDDFGRMDGDAFTVKHTVFSTSPRTEAEFNQALHGMAAVGLIQRYEVEGRIYLQVNDFDPHQPGLHKRRASRFPEAPGNSRQVPEIPSELRREEEQELRREQEGEGAAAPAALLSTWNAHRGELPEALRLTPDRHRHAKARLAEHSDLAWWVDVVRRMALSAFCRGETGQKGWRADFDFLVRPGTAEKVLEGKYGGSAREPPFTGDELKEARALRRSWGRCEHGEDCSGEFNECVGRIIRANRSGRAA